jgi:hypothetical protein
MKSEAQDAELRNDSARVISGGRRSAVGGLAVQMSRTAGCVVEKEGCCGSAAGLLVECPSRQAGLLMSSTVSVLLGNEL